MTELGQHNEAKMIYIVGIAQNSKTPVSLDFGNIFWSAFSNVMIHVRSDQVIIFPRCAKMEFFAFFGPLSN